jgi:hypothetical protein
LAASVGAVAADTQSQRNGWYAVRPTISDTRKANMFVLTPDLGLGDAGAQSTPPPTWPPNPEPIAGPDAVVNAPAASSLHWGSAGIGAGAGIGAFAIALALAGGLRRRRITRPRSLTTHSAPRDRWIAPTRISRS